MLKTKLVLLEFKSPYHVGWRTPELLIEGFTVHRSLIYASILLEGDESRVNDLLQLRVSATLPTVLSGKCYKLLLPLPPIPSRLNLRKRGLKWITLGALSLVSKLAEFELPFIVNIIEKERRVGKLLVESGGLSTEICYNKGVVHLCTENFELPSDIIRPIERHLNRLDRIANAADIHKVSGYIPEVKLGVVLQGEDNVVEYGVKLLQVLGEIGIGGLRSRGFGKYVEEAGILCENQLLLETSKQGCIVTLGSYVFNELINSARSIIIRKLITGYAGPTHDEYVLPHFNYIGAGSVIYIEKELKPFVRKINTSYIGALMVFNPVTAGVKT